MTDTDVQFLDSAPPAHPLAELFPALPHDELATMCASVVESGIRVPLVVSGNRLVDGRQRAKAALAAGYPMPVREIDPEDVIVVIIALNCQRRSLTKGQKAMIAARMHTLIQQSNAERTIPRMDVPKNLRTFKGLAEAFGVSSATGERARRVERECDPAIAQAVIDGEVALKDAERVAQRHTPVADQRQALKAVLNRRKPTLGAALHTPRPIEDTPDGLPPQERLRDMEVDWLKHDAGSLAPRRPAPRNNLTHELGGAAKFGTVECAAERIRYARAAVEALPPAAEAAHPDVVIAPFEVLTDTVQLWLDGGRMEGECVRG